MKGPAKVLLILIIICMVCVAGYCGYRVYLIQSEYNAGDSVYREADKAYIKQDQSVGDSEELSDQEVHEIAEIQKEEVKASPDQQIVEAEETSEPKERTPHVKYVKPRFVWSYMQMHDEYPDVVGYIYQKDHMSYPILKGETNDTYLRTMINGQYNVCGSIFVDASRNLDDPYTVVYGHNVKNGAMFGSLISYRDPEYAKKNRYFDVYIGMRHYRYYVFAVCTSPIDKDVYNYGLPSFQNVLNVPNDQGTVDTITSVQPPEEIELKDFAQMIKERSDYDIPDCGLGEFTNDDHIICLSTCTINLDYNYRYTVFLRRAFRYSK